MTRVLALTHFQEEMISVPLFTGVIGYITNWSGVLMLFKPVRFYGMRIPGLKLFWPFLPRRVQVIPAISKGGRFGWQGIVPSRVDKMASIVCDKCLSKVGTISDFYQQLEPEKIAEQVTVTAQAEIRDIVARIMEREHPQLWHDLPPAGKEMVFARIKQQLPELARDIFTVEIAKHADQLIDGKLMVIKYFQEHPEKMNEMFQRIGKKELKFMANFGFYFGLPMGVILVFILQQYPYWWVLPVGGVIIGYIVNYLGVAMVFEPVNPRKIGPFTVQGLFIKRQPEVSDVMSKLVAEEVINLENLANELLHGPRSDRFHQMLQDMLRPAVDNALGPARAAVRVAIGTKEYDRIRDSAAAEVTQLAAAITDPAFGRQQAKNMETFFGIQMRKLSYEEFSELLRSAIKQDEWLLFVHGAVLGFGAGLLHLAIFGTGA